MGKAVKKHDRKKTKKAMKAEAAQKKRPAPSSTSTEAQKRQNKMAARATSRTTAQSKKSAATKTTNTTQYTGASYKTQQKPLYQPSQYTPDSRYVYYSPTLEYSQLPKKSMSNNVDLQTLVNAGVTQQDIQAVLNAQGSDNKRAEMINRMSTGSVNNQIASWADGVKGECHGDCLSGIQRCFVCVYGSDENSPLCASNPVWNDYRRVEDKNSACSAPKVLKRSGDFLTVTVPNYASVDYRGKVSNANQRMNNFNDQLKPGTLIVASGRNLPTDERGIVQGKHSRSEIHGHIWAKDHKGRSCSDGVQSEIKFFNYGPTLDISISMDAAIDRELAIALLEQKERRLMQERYKASQKRR